MSIMYLALMLILVAYLFGSFSSAVIACKALGHPDPRHSGSGNPGATNVLRLYGKTAAVITLAGDLLKGLLPLLIGKSLLVPDATLAAMGVAAFVGHLYPIFFGFHGGKGVATFIGVLYGIAWPLGAVFMLVWLAVALIFRYSSLSALVAAASTPFLVPIFATSPYFLVSISTMVLLIYWRHRANIRNLRQGNEHKIGAS